MDLHIDDQPGLVENKIFELHAGELPYRAPGPITTDNVASRYRPHIATRILERGKNLITGVCEVDQFRPEFDRHAIETVGMVAKRHLDGWLREDHARRVAERIGLGDHIDPADQLSIGAEMLGCSERRHVRQHLIGNAHIVEMTHDLVVYRNCTRLIVDASEAIDDEGGVPFLAKHAGRHGSGRTETHDKNIDIAGDFALVLH